MQAIKGFVGLSDSNEGGAAPTLPGIPGISNDQEGVDCASCGITLTLQQRWMGFASCFGIGMLISFLSTMQILKPLTFALLYSLGNFVSFLATGFLIGPKRQCKSACESSRALATFLFLGSIIATIVAAVYVKSVILCIFLIIVQFCALVWYTASYIPFAQSMISSTCRSCVGRVTG
jgi:hypothetical protein